MLTESCSMDWLRRWPLPQKKGEFLGFGGKTMSPAEQSLRDDLQKTIQFEKAEKAYLPVRQSTRGQGTHCCFFSTLTSGG